MLLIGCPREGPQPTPPAMPRASVALRVLIVNEPQLVEAFNRLRGEWAERSGGSLSAAGTTWKELSDAKEIDADVVLFPSRYLGEFCARGWLRPVRPSVMESADVRSTDYFPLVRNELIRFGGQTMALPLSVDATALTPTAGPPSIKLLALAAPHAISNERLGVLFDTDTMKPRITESAFVDALVQLAASKVENGVATPQKQPRIPVLGFNDRLAAVTSSSHNAAIAFKLLEWLAKPDTSSQFAQVVTQHLPPRWSPAFAAAWRHATESAGDREEQDAALDALLRGQQSLVIPRIAGIDEYLAALDDAVKSAITKKVSPTTALQSAAEQWEKITDAHGRDKQRGAYQKHLGISDK